MVLSLTLLYELHGAKGDGAEHEVVMGDTSCGRITRAHCHEERQQMLLGRMAAAGMRRSPAVV
jgi:hypothetical protein